MAGCNLSLSLGSYQVNVDAALVNLKAKRIIRRIWDHDYTIWKCDPTEISNRLGWLHIAEVMRGNIQRMATLTESVRADGYTHAILLGMGGSSLAPEVFRRSFGVRDGYLDLTVLDSTDPDAVLAQAESLDLNRTLFIVSTKSGGTVETLSLFKFFYNKVVEVVGANRAGEHFIAITDPGSGLTDLARRCGFRDVLLNDSTIGGRYSALSYFGLVPAMLIGVDVDALLDRARDMMDDCSTGDDNPGALLGAVMSELSMVGRDKLTLVISPPIAALGAWIEQLIAESTGKDGRGILPVDGEPLGPPDVYGDDRLFVYLRLEDDRTYDAGVRELIRSGQPVVQIDLRDRYDLGGEFFRWEIATAVAGYRLGINPFDQPNVESAKKLARDIVSAYKAGEAPPSMPPKLKSDGITVYATFSGDDVSEILSSFLRQAKPGDYIAVQAYIRPTEETDAALQRFRVKLRDHLKLATTVGYGPRFLHSTGQLHKGDAGNGLFIQLTVDDRRDAPIPDEAGADSSSVSFGMLKAAQALGDLQAMMFAWRRVVRFHFTMSAVDGIEALSDSLQ